MSEAKLLELNTLSADQKNRCVELMSWGVLPHITQGGHTYVSSEQLRRLEELTSTSKGLKSETLFQLFPSDMEFSLSENTSLSRTTKSDEELVGGEVLLQLLPVAIAENPARDSALTPIALQGTDKLINTKSSALRNYIENQQSQFASIRNARSSSFSRSAHYMGSKASLAPAICEVIDSFHPVDGVILDLMCGSGAASGAFSRCRKTFSSDAQAFSRLLATIQGGGLTEAIGKSIVDKVTHIARGHFKVLESMFETDLERESAFLTMELGEFSAHEFSSWVSQYIRVGSSDFSTRPDLVRLLEERKSNPTSYPYVLFTLYYANLFFGIRQAAEIDSLRYAIDQLIDPKEREWALGALICAVSACANSYGGHFAQPRVDPTLRASIESQLETTLFRRGLSVTQEFSARLVNLAHESESCSNMVTPVAGPWQQAVQSMDELVRDKKVLVYLDPPYTRDEYSRYYHVLETLVLYTYPGVTGKASVPIKGDGGRFSSEFFSRNLGGVEEVLIRILRTCLDKGWSCLWSYASSGNASIAKVLDNVPNKNVLEVFQAKYSHTSQGRRSAKKVDEYLIFIDR